ncbi:MAG: SCP2 sterol-binding domain-containing protein [Nannocystaceae bacterium]
MVRWEVASHPQEVAENTVDCSHLKPVHHVESTEVLSIEQRDHAMRVILNMVTSGAQVGMPDEINDVELDVQLEGLGLVVSTTRVKNAELCTRQRIYPTPIDRERIAIFGASNIRVMADPGYTAEIDQIFWEAFNADFPRDFPIWGNKAYIDRPLLAGGDGPIGRYRRWARRFYDYEAAPEAASPAAEAPAAEAAPAATRGRRRLGRVRSFLLRVVDRIDALNEGGANGRSNGAHSNGAHAGGAHSNGAHAGGGHEDEDDAPFVPRAPTVRPPPPPSDIRFDSVNAYFDGLSQRFDADVAGDMEAVIQWVLTGEGARSHFARIEGGALAHQDGVHPSPTLTLEMSADDYLKMINGELHGARAFASGRGKLRGPVRLAMKMQRLFPLEKEL